MKKAGVTDPSKCLFIDDNRRNVDAARELGWARCVHFFEKGLEHVEGGKVKEIGSNRAQDASANDIQVVNELEELRTVWPDVFKTT